MPLQQHESAEHPHRSHMFMLQDIYAFECTTNPRCIRPDDYHPADDPLIRHDLSQIAEEDMGTVPLFRIFATTYVSLIAKHVGIWMFMDSISGEHDRLLSELQESTAILIGTSILLI